MNVNNNNNIYNTSFKSTSGENEMSLDKNADMILLMDLCTKDLSEKGERMIPENGKFSKVMVGFYVPNSNNKGMFKVEHDTEDPKTQRILSIGVYHKNSDRVISNILKVGTKKEILDYVKSKENTQVFIDTINALSEKTDEYYASL